MTKQDCMAVYQNGDKCLLAKYGLNCNDFEKVQKIKNKETEYFDARCKGLQMDGIGNRLLKVRL